jgi:hypothetical protein
MTLDRAPAKISRWVDRQSEPFTKQQAWQANKGGALKASGDLDRILGALVAEGLIELLPSEGRRSPTYRALRDESEPAQEIGEYAAPSEPRTPEHNESVAAVAAAQETPPRSVAGSVAVVTSPPLCNPKVSDADVLALAATRRRWDGRIDHDLEAIEARHDGKRAGDTLRATDLTAYDETDMANIRKWLGTEPSFNERFVLVARRVKQLDPQSRKSRAVAEITSAVRLRNAIPKGTGITSGYFHVQEIARLETILDGVE